MPPNNRAAKHGGGAGGGGKASPKKNICARGRSKSNGTCFTVQELREIKSAYEAATGERMPNKGGGRSRAALYQAVLDAFRCRSGDRCLLEKVPAPLRPRLREALIPMAPTEWLRNPTEWLSNYDIEAKMGEIVRAQKNYEFLGVHPMDFDAPASGDAGDGGPCVAQEVCEFDPYPTGGDARARNRFCVVFNTDTHDGPGVHWVALMGNLSPRDPRFGVYYYDSNGMEPPGEVNAFVERVCDRVVEKTGKTPVYAYNDYQHQTTDTECGMFRIAFLDYMMNSKRTFADMCRRMSGDSEMIRLRSVYFEMP